MKKVDRLQRINVVQGTSFSEIVTTERSEKSAFGGILMALILSSALWGAIAAVIWWVV